MNLLKPFKKLKSLVLDQLKQGTSPEKLSFTFSVTFTIAICPVLGITTLFGVIAGQIWKLNHPIIQSLNYMLYPLQLLMIPVFIKSGDRIFKDGLFDFSLSQSLKDFSESKAAFFSKYGELALYAFLLWAILAPVLTLGLHFLMKPIFLKHGKYRDNA